MDSSDRRPASPSPSCRPKPTGSLKRLLRAARRVHGINMALAEGRRCRGPSVATRPPLRDTSIAKKRVWRLRVMPCINAVSFHEDPSPQSVCDRIRAAGFDKLEVSRPPFYDQLTTRAQRQEFFRQQADEGLALYGFDCWVDVYPYDRIQETLAEFQRAVEFAADIAAGMIISHDPWQKDNGNRHADECLAVNIELFKQVADMCAAEELTLVFEPHPDTLSMNDDWCIAFIDGLERPNVGVLYDCCHYGVGQPDTYVDAIGKLGDRIKHIHFSDGDCQTYALHYVIGNGNLDLTSIVQALQSINYSGTLTNDMFNNPDLDAGARENLPRVQAVLAELGLND